MDTMTQFMRMPFGMVASSLEAFADAVRQVNGGTACADVSRPLPAALLPAPPLAAYPQAPPMAAYVNTAGVRDGYSPRRDSCSLGDNNLNDDMVKLVKWTVLYTKPDEEEFFKQDHEVVNYRADAAQFGGQRMARWIDEHRTEPKVAKILTSKRDLRYLQIAIEVVARYPKGEAEYERRQAQAIEGICGVLGGTECGDRS